MISDRIKLLRLAKGLSQQDLVNLMGGVVSKQSISKYERGLARPSVKILNQLATALGVKSSALWADPNIEVKFIAYRKGSRLGAKEQEKLESKVKVLLEEWVKLRDIITPCTCVDIPIQNIDINCLEDTESAASEIRKIWKLGLSPISSIVNMLENHNVFVVECGGGHFDGISAIAKSDNNIMAAAVASKNDIPGERQRLNLVHELGHLVLKVADSVDEEKAAFRFGAALLAPKETIYREVGSRRSRIRIEELLLLKSQLGLSIQALIYRLHDLKIINDSCKRQLYTYISKMGWKRKEPQELIPEKSHWLRQSVLHALSEGLLTHAKAKQMLGVQVVDSRGEFSAKRQMFSQLSLSERSKAIKEQAKKAAADYSFDDDWFDMEDAYGSRE